MIPYTKQEINTILYSIDNIDELKILVDYLATHAHYYGCMREWIEDIRLLINLL